MSKKFVYVEGVTKKYEVLKEAMKYLAKDKYETIPPGKHEYICTCVQSVFGDNFTSMEEELKDEIRIRLNGYSSLESWLVKEASISYRSISKDYYKNSQTKLQATRKAWMQSMYEEFKAKDE